MSYAEPIMEEDEDDAEEGAAGQSQPMFIEQIAAAGADLAFYLDSQKLDAIAHKCLEAYKRDCEERADWVEAFDRIMDMVTSKREAKAFPWPGASNVKWPLIQKAALKFGSRAYPAIVNGTDVVKCAAVGMDDGGVKRQRGDRVAQHMNYQLLLEMPEWDQDTDRLCHSLPLQGTMFRQVIWDAEYSRPLTTLLSGKDLVVTQGCKDLETVPHFAKVFPLFIHQIEERMRMKVYRQVKLGLGKAEESEKAGEQDMLECHCRYDMDGDGYAEPWIALIHKESEQLLSLKAGFWPRGVIRGQDGKVILARRHVEFVKYEFLPDPDGQFYGIGFGQLLLEDNEIINTILNQLIDAATDQNTGGGFVAQGLNLPGGNLEFARGEWKYVNVAVQDIRQAFFARPTSEPSAVLFNLLTMMIEAGKDLASDQDIMSGNVPANTPATTVLAAIEEGLKVFNSIYKRMYRSLTKEFRLIAGLNATYLSPEQYANVIDQPADPKADYEEQSKDIIPIADPSMTTSAQKLSRAQFLMQVGAGNPLLDQKEILRRVLEAASIDDIESLMPKPDPMQQQMQAEQMKTQLRAAMAEIMDNEASATESMMSARLKFIQGNVAAQTMAIEAAAMRMSLMQMSGGMIGPQAIGQGMGGMGGVPEQPPFSGTGQGPRPAGIPPAGPMGGPPMGDAGPGPLGPVPPGGPRLVPDLQQPVPAGAGQFPNPSADRGAIA